MNHPGSSLRVLLVEDNHLARLGIAALFETQPDLTLVGEATDGARGVSLYAQLLPDVAIVDLQLPLLDGVHVTELIRRNHPDARILILTHHEGDENVYQAVRAGASGYLTKEAPGEQILEAIRTIAAGRKYLPPAIAAQLAARSSQAQLTMRELQVLGLMAEGASNRDIAQRLTIGERTVTTHATNILAKLGAKSRTEAVAIGRQRGLLRPVR